MISTEFVRDQLESLDRDIRVIFKSEYALVQCPFHKDGQETNPSLMVNLSNAKYEPGFHYCLSCGAKGNWLNLAEALSLEGAIDPTQQSRSAFSPAFKIKKLTLPTPEKPLIKRDKSISMLWTANDTWRGISGALLQKLQARLRLDAYTKDKQIDLPVKVAGQVIGHIYGLLTKRDKALGSSYINSPGAWVKDALFPLDFVVATSQESKNYLPLCIVEGPRDALNLLQYGLPALAILGCTNWSKKNIPLLLSCKFKNLIVLMDGDEAGRAAAESIYKDLTSFVDKKYITKYQLPASRDPADLNKDEVESLLREFTL